MSYILDALRRADTERGRGAVPGIHSQLDNPAAAVRAAPPRSRALLWAVVALSAALVAVIAWMLLRGSETAAPRIEAAAPVVVPTPAPEEPVAPPAPAQVVRDIVPTSPPPVEQSPPPTRHVLPAEIPPPVRRPPAAAKTTAPATRHPPAPPAAGTGSEPRIYAINELPDNIRSSLPKLSIGGAMYSSNAASRMLIVDGQLMHEGDKLAPELVLERIELKRAVLSFRGYRYSISY